MTIENIIANRLPRLQRSYAYNLVCWLPDGLKHNKWQSEIQHNYKNSFKHYSN